MPRIATDPTWATCPSFEDPEWEFLRQTMVDAHQGDQPLTIDEATQQLKEAWNHENGCKVAAWNAQLEQDQAEQDERNRVAQDKNNVRRAQQEREVEIQHQEAEAKKPKLNPFDPEHLVAKWIEPLPAPYALNKLNNLEYVELDYFMMKGCQEAAINTDKSISHDTLTFTQLGDSFALCPLAAQRPSRHIRNDEDLSWEEMLDARNSMLHFMAKSRLWPAAHAESIAAFFLNLELHPRKAQKNGKKALICIKPVFAASGLKPSSKRKASTSN